MGNTFLDGPESLLLMVHPHVHGEHATGKPYSLVDFGSSPRTWGTLYSDHSDRRGVRFIPTYMGNTSLILLTALLIAVHPHVHGEHCRPPPPHGMRCGSSPRTWGTLFSCAQASFQGRFIPTYMGNTGPRAPPFLWWSVHPHVHGEHLIATGIERDHLGSSPRTWGTPLSR